MKVNNDEIYSPTLGNSIPNQQQDPVEEKGIFSHFGAELIDFIQTLVVFGAIFAIIYLFVAQPHKVSGSSMFPNFHDGDYILTDKMTYRFRDPKPGDVIVLKYPKDETQDFIKRVIATPGETLEVKDNQVYVNGNQISEAYLPPNTPTQGEDFLHNGDIITVGRDQYFVFGDNRPHSSDSREWGAVTKEEIIGKVLLRYWPPNVATVIRSGIKSANF
jgi:signal peptidase I